MTSQIEPAKTRALLRPGSTARARSIHVHHLRLFTIERLNIGTVKIERTRLLRVSLNLTFMWLCLVWAELGSYVVGLGPELGSADLPVSRHFLLAYSFLECVRGVRRFAGLMAISDFLVVWFCNVLHKDRRPI